MKLNLVVLTAGKWEGKTIPITLSQFVIGRDPQCHLRPASPVISKRHCALLVRNDKLFLRDFDSTNGTFVNERQIKGELELLNGDCVKVGPVAFRVQMETAAKPAPAAKAPAEKVAAEKAVAESPDMTNTVMDKPVGKGGVDDDSVADMWMSILDDGSPVPPPSGGDGVPEGSTVLDITAPPGTDPALSNKEKEKEKPKPPGNTSNAAKAILEKYMRRPRAPG